MVSDLICFDVLASLLWRVETTLNTGKKHRWGFPSASIHRHHVRIWPVMGSMNVRRTFLPSSAQFTDTDVGWEVFSLYVCLDWTRFHLFGIFQRIQARSWLVLSENKKMTLPTWVRVQENHMPAVAEPYSSYQYSIGEDRIITFPLASPLASF